MIKVGHVHAPVRAIYWAFIGNFFYASENAVAKLLSSDFHIVQILFFYGSVMFITASWSCFRSGDRSFLSTKRLKLHIVRSVTMIATFYTYILALKSLELANVVAIMFVTPVLATILSIPFLGEKVGLYRWLSIGIVKPGYGLFGIGALWAIISAILAAMDTIYTRILTRTETNTTIVIFLSISYVLLTGSLLPFVWITPDLESLLTFLGMGLAGVLAQFGIAHAYRFAGPPVISPIDYTMLLWGVIFGYLCWGELPVLSTYLGSAMLIYSGLSIVYREHKATKT